MGQVIATYKGQDLIVVNDGERGDLCEQLPTAEITHSGVSVIEDPSLIQMKFLLQVFEMDLNPSCVVQSDVFEVTGKTKDRIFQKARKQALDNVLCEDLKGLFEEQRWQTGEIFGRFYAFREYEKGEYRACLLVTDPSNDATTLLYQLSQPSQRRHV